MSRLPWFVVPVASFAIAAASPVAGAEDPPASNESAAAAPSACPTNETGNYLVSDVNLFPHNEILWPGFLTGLKGFDGFFDPISNPLYNESPRIKTEAKLLYIWHAFPDNVLDGGDLNTVALQARLAITDRLAFIATKDGYTWLDPGLFPEEETGFNDLCLGLKYAFIADTDLDLLVTAGARYEWRVGSRHVLQGDNDEISPFVSIAKGFGRFHLEGNVTFRIPFDDDKANNVFQWSVHADYEIFDGVAPVIEFNGLTYLSDADRMPLDVGGYDYANFGSNDVSGNTVVTLALGAAFKLTPNCTLGATYEFPLTDADDDIIDQRVTFAATFTY